MSTSNTSSGDQSQPRPLRFWAFALTLALLAAACDPITLITELEPRVALAGNSGGASEDTAAEDTAASTTTAVTATTSTTTTTTTTTTTVPESTTTTAAPPDDESSNTPTRGDRYAGLLAALAVEPECDRSTYERKHWRHWISWPGAASDVRQAILSQQSLIPVELSKSGRVLTGEWFSVYDQVRTTVPRSFDVDHVVPLAEAHDSGGCTWDNDRRKEFANDPPGLLAVSASSNRSKGARDPQNWMPKNEPYACWYLVYWMEIKNTWNLSVDGEEHAFLARQQGKCAADDLESWPSQLEERD